MIKVLLPRGAGAAATGFVLCFTAVSSSTEVVEVATVGVPRDRALNDGRENRSVANHNQISQYLNPLVESRR